MLKKIYIQKTILKKTKNFSFQGKKFVMVAMFIIIQKNFLNSVIKKFYLLSLLTLKITYPLYL